MSGLFRIRNVLANGRSFPRTASPVEQIYQNSQANFSCQVLEIKKGGGSNRKPSVVTIEKSESDNGARTRQIRDGILA